MILLGVGREDSAAVALALAEKVANLRIFEDAQGKMNRSLLDVKGAAALVVSQFTLYGDARGQRRRSWRLRFMKSSTGRCARWASPWLREFFRR
jgi:D-tyrosyl-tRNA(Tyr) deacylase